jgi:hypothetical protein
MLGFFNKKKPPSVLDSAAKVLYGDPLPPKRADLEVAIELAYHNLLADKIPKEEVSLKAKELNAEPIPFSTNDLALSVALSYFKLPSSISLLQEAQLTARLQMIKWLQEESIHPQLARSFESVLYKLYK